MVRNCNPASKLTAFPFLPLEEALAESGLRLGDPTRERTEGMYSRQAEEKKPAAEGKDVPGGFGPVEAAASNLETAATANPHVKPEPTASTAGS